jgi:hypothetical protein
MKPPSFRRLLPSILAGIVLGIGAPSLSASASPKPMEEFPHKNFWVSFTPSVVWCGDAQSTTTIEVHIVGRSDVRTVWMANLAATGDDPPLKPFDDSSKGLLFYNDGSHGDAQAGDNVFTHDGIVLPCTPSSIPNSGLTNFWGYVRVELADGRLLGESYGNIAGIVHPKYKQAFSVRDLGDNLSATAYALFIQDARHEVMDDYPVANVYCGTSNFMAYRKLYSVLPDSFDFALVMPGMQLYRTGDFYENVPYEISVSNSVEHIGMDPDNNTANFGSAGRLKSIVFHSFGDVFVSTHEIGHTWGMFLGSSLGLVDTTYGGHWSASTDIGGVMATYYPDGAGNYGRFSYNGDETWRWISNMEWDIFSPLELYAMGLIPSEEVPPVHILQSPDLTNLGRITAKSYTTLPIGQIMAAEGGERIPSNTESQKDFNVAFIVSQDNAYNDAAYAFFSLLSYRLTSKSAPDPQTRFMSFYWATGGRGTLNSRLPVDVADPAILPESSAPTATPEIAQTKAEKTIVESTGMPPSAKTPALEPTARPAATSPICSCPLLAVGLTILPGAWVAMRRKRAGNTKY